MRTIVESARTMMINANLSKDLWAEAVSVAVYTINRTGTSSRKDMTPYELLYRKSFDINLLRTFGDKVCVHIPKQRRCKWDPKGQIGIFVGYGYNTKGYRVWFKDEGKVDTFRDVTFVQRVRVSEEIQQREKELLPEREQEIEEKEGTEVQNVIVQDESQELEEGCDKEDNVQKEQQIEDLVRERESDVGSDSSDLEYEEEHLEEEWFSSDEARIEEGRTRRGRRIIKPKWTDDYELGMVAQGNIGLTYEEAVNGKDKNKWLEAIKEELEAFKRNDTWIETELPKGEKTIDCKWVFKIKKDQNREIYKARLVARGFKQEEKFDHSEVYAPVAKLPTLRILLAIASKHNLDIQQMDVKSAFLNGRIDEEVYLVKPEGMKNDGKVLKLRRSLYGLKKSPRYWNERFDKLMMQEGFIRSKCDYCLYYKKGMKFYVLLYVDDVLLISEDINAIKGLKEELSKNFDMKDMNGVSKYLGINIKKNEKCIEIDQEDYLIEILKKYNMEECKPVSTPIEVGIKLERSKEENVELIKRCRTLIGSLMYAMLGTRPDICYALSYLSRYQAYANEDVWKGLKRVLRYIKGTLKFKLVYKIGIDEPLVGYTDADWGGEQADRKSTSGYIMKVYGCVVSWSSNKQQCVALSSTEAEYVALARGISEGCWIKNMLTEINLKCDNVIIYEDNQSAIYIAKNPEHHKRLKHIDLKYHFIRDKIKNRVVILRYIQSNEQVADICTKPLHKLKFENCIKKLLI